jgi:nicotinate-nucleotide adenylyltransferase
MTLGVLGGTFDPIHVGHLAAGDGAQQALRLDRVLLVPSRMPPHRPEAAAAEHRLAMATLAARERRAWSASDVELQRDGPSYTFDTLVELRRTASQIFFIIGADAFAEIATWSRYPAVLDLAHFVVVARPGITLDSLTKRVPDLAGRMTTPDRLEPSAATRIILVEASTPDISSTDIRRRVAAGAPIAGLVPAAVADYIAAHRLYRATSQTVGPAAEAGPGK